MCELPIVHIFHRKQFSLFPNATFSMLFSEQNGVLTKKVWRPNEQGNLHCTCNLRPAIIFTKNVEKWKR